jgi:hypothetical protein
MNRRTDLAEARKKFRMDIGRKDKEGGSLAKFLGVDDESTSKENNYIDATNKLVFVDMSYSMDDEVGALSKWKHLLAAMDELFEHDDMPIIAFARTGMRRTLGQLFKGEGPCGNTNMLHAFEMAKNDVPPAKSAFIISDGEPTSPEQATLDAAVELGIPFDTFYIGPDDTRYNPGLDFMKKLAELTGGKHDNIKADEKGILQLKNKIAGLLGGSVQSGPINL